MMASGSAANAQDQYIRISEGCTLESLKASSCAVVSEFDAEYLRASTALDIVKACVVLHNMTVEAQRDGCEGAIPGLQNFLDVEVTETGAR